VKKTDLTNFEKKWGKSLFFSPTFSQNENFCQNNKLLTIISLILTRNSIILRKFGEKIRLERIIFVGVDLY